METMSIKLDDNFAHDIEQTRKKYRYTTKTEFVREAIRDKISRLEMKEALKRLHQTYGASKRKTTDAQLHAAREKAAQELLRELS
jgi:Arc/MetJ-type ribon-helix-helix transcriptional regulator